MTELELDDDKHCEYCERTFRSISQRHMQMHVQTCRLKHRLAVLQAQVTSLEAVLTMNETNFLATFDAALQKDGVIVLYPYKRNIILSINHQEYAAPSLHEALMLMQRDTK